LQLIAKIEIKDLQEKNKFLIYMSVIDSERYRRLIYNFLSDESDNSPEAEIVRRLPIYKNPDKNSPESKNRPYWFSHDRLKKKLYNCLPTINLNYIAEAYDDEGWREGGTKTWKDLMDTPAELCYDWIPIELRSEIEGTSPPDGCDVLTLGSCIWPNIDEETKIRRLRLWILACLSTKGKTWGTFLNSRIDAAVRAENQLLIDFEQKQFLDYLSMRDRMTTTAPSSSSSSSVSPSSFPDAPDAPPERDLSSPTRLSFGGNGRKKSKKNRKKRSRRRKKRSRRRKKRSRRRKKRRRSRRRRQRGGNQYGRQMAMAPPMPPPASPR
jgi:hypothetical protein